MTPKAIAALVATALAILALSGCLRVVSDTSIGSDDTFSQHVIVAFNDTVASQVNQEAGINISGLTDSLDMSDEFAALQAKYPDQVSIEDYSDKDLHGVELTLTDLPLSEISDAGAELTAGFGATATIEHVGDAFVVTMSAPATGALGDDASASPGSSPSPDPTGASGALGALPGDLDSLGLDSANLSLLESAIEFEISYTFPGLVTEASAGDIDGNTVTLGVGDLLSGKDIRLVGGDSTQINWWPFIKWALIVAAFTSVIGAAALLVRQDKRRQRTNTLPAPTMPDAPPPPSSTG